MTMVGSILLHGKSKFILTFKNVIQCVLKSTFKLITKNSIKRRQKRGPLGHKLLCDLTITTVVQKYLKCYINVISVTKRKKNDRQQ